MTTFLSALTAFFLFFTTTQVEGDVSTIPDSSADPTTFVIVRHAEKADNSTDPDLSQAGYDRAARLAAVLQYMNIDGLHATPFKRTRQTLGVIAEKLGLPVHEYEPKNPNSLLDALKAEFGKTYVIAGHSNTAPRIVNYLSGNSVYNDLEDHMYDPLWIVHFYPDGTSKTV